MLTCTSLLLQSWKEAYHEKENNSQWACCFDSTAFLCKEQLVDFISTAMKTAGSISSLLTTERSQIPESIILGIERKNTAVLGLQSKDLVGMTLLGQARLFFLKKPFVILSICLSEVGKNILRLFRTRLALMKKWFGKLPALISIQ